MGTWTNSDGLFIRFGADEATLTTAGEYGTVAEGLHVTECKLILDDDFPSASTVQANTSVIPSGATIHKVVVISEIAATSGGSATLNVGLNRLDRTTAIDADGLVEDLALASINANGETTTLLTGAAPSGALIGTTLSNPGIFVADYDTAAFTGENDTTPVGNITVKVFWYVI